MSKDPFVEGLRLLFQNDDQLKPAGVSVVAGLDKSTIRKMLENPNASPLARNAAKIAGALGYSIEEIIYIGETSSLPPARCAVPVVGRVGAGAQVPVFDTGLEGASFRVAAPPGLSPRDIVAVEVQGDSMEPVYSDGDLLFYTRATHDGVPDEAIGHRCVAEDADGMGWVKQVKRGDSPGHFHLVSLNPGAASMWNVPLRWAARVRLHWPAELVRKL
jgi:hypothetical protein